MKFKSIKLTEDYRHGFAPGAEPGFKCIVTLQYGRSYETFDVELEDDAVREVAQLAVAKAMAQIAIDPETIDVVGKPGERVEPTAEPVPASVDEATPHLSETPVPATEEPF